MTKTIQAVFDGQVLKPSSVVDLDPGVTYIISIEVPRAVKKDAWTVLNSLVGSVEAPSDWARSTTTTFTAPRNAMSRTVVRRHRRVVADSFSQEDHVGAGMTFLGYSTLPGR
jgi:predicted DNA-binding antitoxin AbrB/MazE fold protein